MNSVKVKKPIMVARQEFIADIYKLINESGLAPVIIKPVLDELSKDILTAMQQQYEIENKQYQAELMRATENTKSKSGE